MTVPVQAPAATPNSDFHTNFRQYTTHYDMGGFRALAIDMLSEAFSADRGL